MNRFCQLLRVAIVLFILVLLFGCIARMTVKETAHYKLYENIVLTALSNVGTWAKTDIHIPKGAIVAVMAKGEIWDITDRGKWNWQPWQCLELKVGKGGKRTNIKMDPNSIIDTEVVYTIFAGKIVYDAKMPK
jgi:uncharacterized membrane protein AbrB (regulator of aidB expression)